MQWRQLLATVVDSIQSREHAIEVSTYLDHQASSEPSAAFRADWSIASWMFLHAPPSPSPNNPSPKRPDPMLQSPTGPKAAQVSKHRLRRGKVWGLGDLVFLNWMRNLRNFKRKMQNTCKIPKYQNTPKMSKYIKNLQHFSKFSKFGAKVFCGFCKFCSFSVIFSDRSWKMPLFPSKSASIQPIF